MVAESGLSAVFDGKHSDGKHSVPRLGCEREDFAITAIPSDWPAMGRLASPAGTQILPVREEPQVPCCPTRDFQDVRQ